MIRRKECNLRPMYSVGPRNVGRAFGCRGFALNTNSCSTPIIPANLWLMAAELT